MQRTGNVISNFIWRFAERCGAQLVTFIVSIVLGIILYLLFAVTSLDGALGFSDFLFYIFLRIITSLIYIIAQILIINNCRDIKKHDKNNAEKFIKETKQMSLKTFLIWLLFFIIGCVRIYNIIW